MRGDGRHLVHGGVGRFYDFPYINATVLFPSIDIQGNGFGTIYDLENDNGIRNPDGSLFHPGQPLPPGGAKTPGVGTATNVASPGQATPYSDQISLGYSWQATSTLGFTADVIQSKYNDIPYRFRFNSKLDANGNTTITAQNPDGTLRFPEFSGSARMWMGDGEATYRGLNLSFHWRQPNVEIQGFYTLSRATGNVLAGADEFRLSDPSFQAEYGQVRDRTTDSTNPKCSACF